MIGVIALGDWERGQYIEMCMKRNEAAIFNEDNECQSYDDSLTDEFWFEMGQYQMKVSIERQLLGDRLWLEWLSRSNDDMRAKWKQICLMNRMIWNREDYDLVVSMMSDYDEDWASDEFNDDLKGLSKNLYGVYGAAQDEVVEAKELHQVQSRSERLKAMSMRFTAKEAESVRKFLSI